MLAKWVVIINRAHEYGHDLTPSERRDLAVDLLAADTRCAALTVRVHQFAMARHMRQRHDVGLPSTFATCQDPVCVADRALLGEGT